MKKNDWQKEQLDRRWQSPLASLLSVVRLTTKPPHEKWIQMMCLF